jgi:RNA polymerase sigma factor (sigma-70 family)
LGEDTTTTQKNYNTDATFFYGYLTYILNTAQHHHSIMTQFQEEFLTAFEPIREPLWRFIRAMVFKYDNASAEIANDIMSETILQSLESFNTIRDAKAMLSFCFTIASRTYKSQFVRRKFWIGYEEALAIQIPDQAPLPDTQMDIRLLYEVLHTLPPPVKEAIILFELSGLSLQEIRVIQGGTLSGVKARIYRGKKVLSRRMGENTGQNFEENDDDEYEATNEFPKLINA